jgi:hypothetical protein
MNSSLDITIEGTLFWGMKDVIAFPKPIPPKGQLGLWNYKEGDK